jgi:DNA-binding response OmpR family regulator
MRILIVEDEPALAHNVAAALQGAGFKADHAPTAGDARALLASCTYEALILDLRLPDGDGLSIVRSLRLRGSNLAVLALTARDTIEDRVLGLDAGADDYLIKPFAMDELLARIRALLRRPGAVLGERLSAGNVTVLMDQLYGIDEDPPLNAVPVHVHHLRRRLQDAGATMEIVTFRGIGYMATAQGEASS